MKIQSFVVVCVAVVMSGCNKKPAGPEIWKQEIVQTEKDFAKMAADKGIHEAFLAFAAEDVAILRDNRVISGKNSLDSFYLKSAQDSAKITLSWSPDFVDVSASGDLGYTYGKYEYRSTDTLGETTIRNGIFHTVWKRQKNGEWKYVWD